jgi:galactose mutarotase-like enzyme
VLTAGELTAIFLPGLGMTGVVLRYRGAEHLALPGGLDALRRDATLGLPLLAPWANRLATRRYRAAGVAVDLTGLRLGTDDHGLPIHGLLVGKRGWQVNRSDVRGDAARLLASIDVDARAFPFPHRIELAVVATDASTREAAEAAPIGRRTFDDLYEPSRARRPAFEADDGTAIELRCDANYPFAQVWVPPGRSFGALEPTTAPTNSLGAGTASLVAPGDTFTARFTLALR